MAQGRHIAVEGPQAEQMRLDAAREQVGRNPRDMEAMRNGAEAAMRLGDYGAALDFLNKAEIVFPGDAMIKAARGSVMVQMDKPRIALALFDEAEAAGVPTDGFAADRGLAHDLLGDQPSAQFYYAIANATLPGRELTLRYAFSLAVSGDVRAGDDMLKPLLNADDKGAWRIKAFMLAVSGRSTEAVSLLYGVLPPELAASLAPYMRGVSALTPAQQVAAAHLGIFPKAASLDPSASLVPAGTAFGAN